MQFRLWLENVGNLTFYHGTTTSNLPSILKNGLKLSKIYNGPAGGENDYAFSQWNINGVYLTNDLNRAAWYALARGDANSAAIVEVRIKPEDKLDIDPMDSGHGWNEKNVKMDAIKGLVEVASKLLRTHYDDKMISSFKSEILTGGSARILYNDIQRDAIPATLAELFHSANWRSGVNKSDVERLLQSLNGRKFGALSIRKDGSAFWNTEYYKNYRQHVYGDTIEDIIAVWLVADGHPDLKGKNKVLRAESLPNRSKDDFRAIETFAHNWLSSYENEEMRPHAIRYMASDIGRFIDSMKAAKTIIGKSFDEYISVLDSISKYIDKKKLRRNPPEQIVNKVARIIRSYLDALQVHKGRLPLGNKMVWVRVEPNELPGDLQASAYKEPEPYDDYD